MATLMIFPDDVRITDRQLWASDLTAKIQPSYVDIVLSRDTEYNGMCRFDDLIDVIRKSTHNNQVQPVCGPKERVL